MASDERRGRGQTVGRKGLGRAMSGASYLPHKVVRALAGCGPSDVTETVPLEFFTEQVFFYDFCLVFLANFTQLFLFKLFQQKFVLRTQK
jgi:hypothetical protein